MLQLGAGAACDEREGDKYDAVSHYPVSQRDPHASATHPLDHPLNYNSRADPNPYEIVDAVYWPNVALRIGALETYPPRLCWTQLILA